MANKTSVYNHILNFKASRDQSLDTVATQISKMEKAIENFDDNSTGFDNMQKQLVLIKKQFEALGNTSSAKEFNKVIKQIYTSTNKLQKAMKENVGQDSFVQSNKKAAEYQKQIDAIITRLKELNKQEDELKKKSLETAADVRRIGLDKGEEKTSVLGSAADKTVQKALTNQGYDASDLNNISSSQAIEAITQEIALLSQKEKLSQREITYKTKLDGLLQKLTTVNEGQIKDATILQNITEEQNRLTKEKLDYEKLINQEQIKGITDNSQAGKLVSIEEVSGAAQEIHTVQSTNEIIAQNDAMQELNNTQSKLEVGAGNLTKAFINAQLVTNALRSVFHTTKNTIFELDAAFNGIAIVSSYTTSQVWSMYDAFEGIATRAGVNVKSISNVALEFFRQGRSMSDVLMLTEAAATAAQIAGISAEESVRYLTSALQGYNLQASQAMAVSDKFAQLAAASATDYDGLAIALSKVSSQAYSVGVEMDTLMGFIAKALETTQEAPENIGTAFKTIFARMSQIKDLGTTLEDGMSINSIDTALKAAGVSLRDAQGEIRDLDDVLIEVGYAWDGLTKNTQTYITTALAGTRQQTRLLAVFEDFDKTMELVDQSANSLGATYAQQAVYTESIAFAMNKLQIAWESFISSLSSSGVIIFLTETLTAVVKFVDEFNTFFNGIPTMSAGIASVIFLLGALKHSLNDNNSMLYSGSQATKEFINTLKQKHSVLTQVLKEEIAQAAVTAKSATADAAKATANELIATTGASRAKGSVQVIAGEVAETTATKASTAAILAKKAALFLLNPWVLAAGAAALLAVVGFKAFGKTLNDINEDIKKTQAALYKLNQTELTFEQTISQIESLEKKLVLTQEETEELIGLYEKLNDLGIGEDGEMEFYFGNMDTGLALSEIEAFYDDLRKEQNEYFDEQAKRAQEASRKNGFNFDDAEASTQQALSSVNALNEAIRTGVLNDETGRTYADFLRIDSDIQNDLIKVGEIIAKNADIADQFKTEVRGFEGGEIIVDPSKYIFVDENGNEIKADSFTKASTGTNAMNSGVSGDMVYTVPMNVEMVYDANSGSSPGEFISSIQEDMNNLLEKNLDINSLVISLQEQAGTFNSAELIVFKDTLTSLYPELNAVYEVSELLNGQQLGANWDIDTIQTLYDSLGEIDSLSGETFEKLASSIFTFEGSNPMEGVVQSLATLGDEALTADDTIKILNTSIEALYGDATNNFLDMAKTFGSVSDNVNGFLDSVREGSVDLEEMKNITAQYPDIWKQMTTALQQGDTSGYTDILQAEAEVAVETQRQVAIAKLKLEQGTIEMQKAALQEKINMLSSLLTGEAKSHVISTNQLQTKLTDQLHMYEQFYTEIQKAGAEVEAGTFDGMIEQISGGSSSFSASEEEIQSLINIAQTEINSLTTQYGLLGDQIEFLETMPLNFFSESASGADDASGSTEEYIAKLNELYLIRLKLDALESLRSYIDQDQQLAAAKLLGTENESLDLAILSNDNTLKQIELLEYEIELRSREASILKEQQNAIHEQLKTYGNLVDVSSGRTMIDFSEMNKLDSSSREEVEGLIEQYNQLREEIESTISALKDQEIAIYEMIGALKVRNKEIEETLENLRGKEMLQAEIDLQELILGAIQDREQAKIDALQKSLDEERELLERRKEIYEKHFEAMDFEDDLSSIDEQRDSLLEQIAALSTATDSTSAAKRKELEEELAELNEEYNSSVTDYNRENMWNEDEEELSEKEQEIADLEERLSNMSNFYDEMNQIITAGDQAIKDFLIANSQEYADATEESKEMLLITWDEEIARRQEIADEIEDLQAEYLDNLDTIAQAEEMLAGLQEELAAAQAIRNEMMAQSYHLLETSVTNSLNGIIGALNAVASAATSALNEITKVNNTPINPPSPTYGNNQSGGYSSGVSHSVYATGGTTARTGWHWLDGAPGKEERVLSPTQTKIVDNMLAQVRDLAFGDTNQNDNSVVIQELIFSVGSLGSGLDISNAANTFAAELQKALKSRGSNINQKR